GSRRRLSGPHGERPRTLRGERPEKGRVARRGRRDHKGRNVAKLLEVEGLRTHFLTSVGVVKAVDGISYEVGEGETVAVVGESGCGKSVGALSILRLIPHPPGKIMGGRIRFNGRDLLTLDEEEIRRVRGREIGMIFQEPMTSLNPVLTIGLQLTETVRQHMGVSQEAAEARAIELLGMVGISEPQ